MPPIPIAHYDLGVIADQLRSHTLLSIDAAHNALRAAVAMVLRPDAAGVISVSFIRRAVREGDPWSGQMAFPGGHVEVNDASIEAAARREAHEEIGLQLAPEALLGALDEVDGRPVRKIIVSPFVYRCEWDGPVALSEEVSELVWVPLAFLGEVGNIEPYHAPGYGAELAFPSYRYGEYVIWGMTARIIVNFMQRFDIDLPLPDPRDVR